MEWHVTDAQSLAIIDHEIGEHVFSPAEYEIIRRVIYATSDFEYKSLIRFSERALQAAAAALAARTTIVVDVPLVQAGIAYDIQNTFANPVYCSMEAVTRLGFSPSPEKESQKEKTRAAWGIEILAKRFPEAIFVVGQAQTALMVLVDLIEAEEIRPALIIATPGGFLDIDTAKERLRDSLVPSITLDSRKGNAIVAAAIIDGLVDLAWQAYGEAE
ncbi:precorrin-8X methylmutase [Aetokthonos hydrillicola Thurmond2011]|jgi:precorrin-8X/cobalt-precorrin-8 methylmutase|uniref:Precorrin-8X methylmutase n=2 Tax=Aetokthonos TaxID=1550243 RepID=A0AAP5M8A7_9CYAN|nr:precorrin-8X methylmutase [Aetokthonos hydrillicola]MBW4588073.1 precorrin-8X methylmutase [Aetokthonos hydrillicola CCALA 1050]MDR9893388.1 precorrin-8X methylmutase [Aetokthonos hydrillicola Thurmond2011]